MSSVPTNGKADYIDRLFTRTVSNGGFAMTKDEALRLALDALEDARHHMSAIGAPTERQLEAQEAIRVALATPTDKLEN